MAGSQPPRSDAHLVTDELSQLFDALPDLFCVAGFDGTFRRMNPAWRLVLGWTQEQLHSRPFLDFVHPIDRPATAAEIDKLATGTITINFENRYRCKGGAYKWLQWTARRVPDSQTICAVARDVTESKRLEKEILDAMDRERERIGRELHDGLCQNLAGITALSVMLARKLAIAPSPELGVAREIGRLLRQSIRHTRDLARGLDPLHLEATGLVDALADFCSNTEALFKIRCRLHSETRSARLAANHELHLYRIVQEAVSNAIVHGRAKRIEVRFAFRNRRGALTIEDDGVGVRPSDRHGIGLHTMAYRARQIGALIELNRRSPHGTVVTCVLPLVPAKSKA